MGICHELERQKEKEVSGRGGASDARISMIESAEDLIGARPPLSEFDCHFRSEFLDRRILHFRIKKSGM
jgi:hypothetical protein